MLPQRKVKIKLNHLPSVPIWNPLWCSIQHPHVSSLHMSSSKREALLRLDPCRKHPPGVTHAHVALFWYGETVRGSVCVFKRRPRAAQTTEFKPCGLFLRTGKCDKAAAEARPALSLQFPWQCVPVWLEKCRSVLRAGGWYRPKCAEAHGPVDDCWNLIMRESTDLSAAAPFKASDWCEMLQYLAHYWNQPIKPSTSSSEPSQPAAEGPQLICSCWHAKAAAKVF